MTNIVPMTRAVPRDPIFASALHALREATRVRDPMLAIFNHDAIMSGNCLYIYNDGCRCAAGYVLPDDVIEYIQRKRLLTSTLLQLVNAGHAIIPPDMVGLQSVQDAHDRLLSELRRLLSLSPIGPNLGTIKIAWFNWLQAIGLTPLDAPFETYLSYWRNL